MVRIIRTIVCQQNLRENGHLGFPLRIYINIVFYHTHTHTQARVSDFM